MPPVSERQRLLPRNSLIWMLVAQSLAMAPLFTQLPSWLVVIWLGVMIWRIMEFLGHWRRPRTVTRLLLVLVCFVGLLVSFGRFLGMEPMVSLLICSVLLKQLEVRRRRDAIVLVYLTYFLLALQFLFSQTLLAGAFGLLCFFCNSVALLSIHQPEGHAKPWRSARIAGVLVLQSVPVMLLLFLVMPRLGSLWAVPSPTNTASTGVSDTMSPGDFVSLSRAGGVAFRVAFDGPLPARNKLYWRGLVFSRFDGRVWEQADYFDYFRDGKAVSWQSEPAPSWLSLAYAEGQQIRYRVIMEPSYQPWLFSLSLVTAYETNASVTLGFGRDFRLLAREPVYQRLAYEVESALDYRLEVDDLPDWRRRNETRLPDGFNPRSLQTATQWRSEVPSDSAYVNRVLAYYRSEFAYTLEPPALGANSVDDFLWDTRAGFCEHFASSFVVMMRAAGIPARVVAGYQGGEYNQLENYLVVHQYDAHAWAEVWLPQRGWVRVDPTAAVAPERVERSLGEALTDEIETLTSLGRYRHIRWIAHLRLQWDAIQYRWDAAVLGFDSEAQGQLLRRWLGDVSPFRLVLMVLVVGGGVLALLSAHLWWQNRPAPRSPSRRFLQRVDTMLAGVATARRPHEAVGSWLRHQATQLPAARQSIERACALYEAQVYAGRPVTAAQYRAVLRDLRQSLPGKTSFRQSSRP